jgi:hypothetical protein
MSPRRRLVPVLLVLSLAVSARPTHAQYTDPGPIAGGSCRPYVEESPTAPALWSQWLCLNLLVRHFPVWTDNVRRLGVPTTGLTLLRRGVRG